MKKADDYRKHAAECRRLAAQMDRRDQREQLLAMALQWEELAHDRKRVQPAPPKDVH
jgi:hypothetical protein